MSRRRVGKLVGVAADACRRPFLSGAQAFASIRSSHVPCGHMYVTSHTCERAPRLLTCACAYSYAYAAHNNI